MRSHRRRHPIQHVLIAGVAEDGLAIQRVLVTLPDDAYGQVFIEASGDADLSWLANPERVSVTRMSPSANAEASRSGVITARGAQVAAAVAGWLAEWMPAEPEPDREFAIWVGAASSEQVDAICLDPLIERL